MAVADRLDDVVGDRTPDVVYDYWEREVWPRGYTIDEEREAETALALALRQISDRGYHTRLHEARAATIRSYAVVFCGKRVWVRSA